MEQASSLRESFIPLFPVKETCKREYMKRQYTTSMKNTRAQGHDTAEM